MANTDLTISHYLVLKLLELKREPVIPSDVSATFTEMLELEAREMVTRQYYGQEKTLRFSITPYGRTAFYQLHGMVRNA